MAVLLPTLKMLPGMGCLQCRCMRLQYVVSSKTRGSYGGPCNAVHDLDTVIYLGNPVGTVTWQSKMYHLALSIHAQQHSSTV